MLINVMLIKKTYSYFPFFLKKGMTDRVPVKGNCVDSRPSLEAETLSRLLLSYHIGYRNASSF